MKKRFFTVVCIALLSAIGLVAILVNSGNHPRIKRTTGREAEVHRARLEQRFSVVLLADNKVRFIDTFSNLEGNLTVGYSITEPGDDGNYRKYTVSSIEADGILVDYLSHFDHRTWGKQLIEEDTGTVKIEAKQAK